MSEIAMDTSTKMIPSTIVITTTKLVSKPNSLVEYVTIENIETKEDRTQLQPETSSRTYILEEINGNGDHKWYNRVGQLHRDGDLPAIIYADGKQEWYKNGKLHRDGDLPAVIHKDGRQDWYKNGKRHRYGDLPAIIQANGTQKWYKEGTLHRNGDLPAYMGATGRQEWYKEGRRHRDGDLPASIKANGNQYWYKEGKPHRDGDLPAVIYSDGKKTWYKDGIHYIPTHLIPTPAINKDKMLAALATLQSTLTELIKEIYA
jgi:hypothetical protein